MDSNSSLSNNNTISIVSTFSSPFESSRRTENGNPPFRKPLSLWPRMYHSPVTNALCETRSQIFERLMDPQLNAPPQRELLNRTPSQSRTTILYNFSSDYIQREHVTGGSVLFWIEGLLGKIVLTSSMGVQKPIASFNGGQGGHLIETYATHVKPYSVQQSYCLTTAFSLAGVPLQGCSATGHVNRSCILTTSFMFSGSLAVGAAFLLLVGEALLLIPTEAFPSCGNLALDRSLESGATLVVI